MKIVVNLLQCPKSYTGTGRYVRNIFRELAQVAPDTEFVQIVSPDNASTFEVGARNFSQVRLPIKNAKRVRRILFEQSVVPFLRLRFRERDVVLWSPSDIPIVGWKGPQVVTLHDVRRMLVPEQFEFIERTYYRGMMSIAARRASRILTVSEHSRRDLHRYYGIPLERIHVGYNAGDPSLKREQNETRINEVLSRYGLRKPYLLFVGQQLVVKGPHLLTEAFAQLRASRPELQLALVGKPGNATPLIKDAGEKHSLGDRLCLIPWVTDEELCCLYSAAEVMVFPSRYEGFGIPVLEAMQCGTPVITTRESCLPEVAGDAAHFLDDRSAGTIAAAIATVLDDSNLRQGMIERGFANAARFTWKITAYKVLEALSAASNSGP